MTDDPLSVCCKHLANSQQIIEAKNAEIARLRLTDAEREAVEWAMDGYAGWMDDNCVLDTPDVQAVLYRLRGILERLK